MPEVHAVATGPIRKAEVELSDGTVVDCRPDYVYVDSLEKAQELAHLIATHYVENGHPDHDSENPFIYNAPKGA